MHRLVPMSQLSTRVVWQRRNLRRGMAEPPAYSVQGSSAVTYWIHVLRRRESLLHRHPHRPRDGHDPRSNQQHRHADGELGHEAPSTGSSRRLPVEFDLCCAADRVTDPQMAFSRMVSAAPTSALIHVEGQDVPEAHGALLRGIVTPRRAKRRMPRMCAE
jgi:hypothetical protein